MKKNDILVLKLASKKGSAIITLYKGSVLYKGSILSAFGSGEGLILVMTHAFGETAKEIRKKAKKFGYSVTDITKDSPLANRK